MSNVVIYTTDYCPYCDRAKSLLKNKGVDYDEKMLQTRDEINELKQRTGMMTVPQIFINDAPIGGCDDLYALDEQGRLDSILK